MEEPLPADNDQQQGDAEPAENGDGDFKASSNPETNSDEFDADLFASLMQQELIAYQLSWDPLMKVLQALGRSMAKQQLTQQNSNAAMKKMEDQVTALREELTRAEEYKKEAAAVMEAMQNKVGEMQDQVGGMQNQLGEIQGLSRLDDQQEQQKDNGGSQESSPADGMNGDGDKSSAVKQSPRSPRASSTSGGQPFVTSKELNDAKKELRMELEKAMALAFGHDAITEAGENEDDDNLQQGGESGINSDPSEALSALRRASGLQSTRGPFASASGLRSPRGPFASAADLQQEVDKLQGLQDALAARMTEHDQLLDALNGRVGKLGDISSQLSGSGNGLQGHSVGDGSNEIGAEFASDNGKYVKQDEFAVTTADILNELKELKAVQDEQDQKLRDHDEAVEKHTADIKALAESLDDLSVQQQTVASMYAPVPISGATDGGLIGGSGSEHAAGSDSGKSGKSERQDGRSVEATSQPQLDLSLVFTKLADLRRSTDASMNSLQQSIKGVSGTTRSQQEQLDALRNNVVFNEHLQAHLVESRLAMQKELLARNQTFQDRTKPQLVEWRKALELTEDKLLQGNSDDEMLQALHQMQRCYHRTLLSIAPLVNSPLSIAETLQTLSDEVKQLQNAVRLGVVPLRVTDIDSSGEGVEGDSNKDDHGEEYARKLRYLDEEIDATLQVNITTEKKNDPLIKGLDTMREKLELLWSMWHRNYNVDRGQPNESVIIHENADAKSSGSGENHAAHEERRQSFQQRNPDGLREMELRLSGAVRRLAMAEEDIERLNSLTAEFNNAARDAGAHSVGRRASSSNNLRTELVMEELEKLRKDMYAEISTIAERQSEAGHGGNGGNNNNTSLVSMDRGSMVEAAAKQGDVLTDLYSQMTGRELDTRFYNSPEGQKQFYENFIKEVTKKVSGLINTEKGGPRGPGIGGAANANVNYRLLLDNFAQKVDDRLEDAREFTTEELARLRRELMEQLKIRFEVALRDIRGELMLLQPIDGDSTAMGTKPVMCVACSRPVPVSHVIREAGSLPADNPEPANSTMPTEFDYDRGGDDFVYRAGFKMPANDRKILTLPFLTTAMRNKMVLNKPEGKRKRPARQSHLSRVDNVVREALELDRASRGRGFDATS